MAEHTFHTYKVSMVGVVLNDKFEQLNQSRNCPFPLYERKLYIFIS